MKSFTSLLLVFLLSGVHLVRGVFLNDWFKAHPGKKFWVSNNQPAPLTRFLTHSQGICWRLQHDMSVLLSLILGQMLKPCLDTGAATRKTAEFGAAMSVRTRCRTPSRVIH